MSCPVPPYPPPPYGQTVCPNPPYNATNFNGANTSTLYVLQSYAHNSPNFPWNTGSDAQQIYRSQQNITYFNNLNQNTLQIKTLNGSVGTVPYPQFKTQAERLMYIQGMTLTAARNQQASINQLTYVNPAAPAGVPCSTIYQIINYYSTSS